MGRSEGDLKGLCLTACLLLPAESSYSKPNISLHPSGGVTPGGGAVTVRCECQCRGARFLLSKAGDPDARCSMDAAGVVAEFPIHSVSRRDAGSYSCQYSIKSDLSVWSEPSDTVELMVGKSLCRVSVRTAPNTRGSWPRTGSPGN
uniref:Ig-like domain-containing protein n=1 Tax=Chrysemys picta bellii TaxID=8478 RepID=A0A8C3H6V7_CHRPI